MNNNSNKRLSKVKPIDASVSYNLLMASTLRLDCYFLLWEQPSVILAWSFRVHRLALVPLSLTVDSLHQQNWLVSWRESVGLIGLQYFCCEGEISLNPSCLDSLVALAGRCSLPPWTTAWANECSNPWPVASESRVKTVKVETHSHSLESAAGSLHLVLQGCIKPGSSSQDHNSITFKSTIIKWQPMP